MSTSPGPSPNRAAHAHLVEQPAARLTTFPEFLAVVTVAWGVFAFGAVYPWAYWPLFIAATLGGLLALASRPRAVTGLRVFALALVMVGVAIGVQLLPVSQRIIQATNPVRHQLLARYDISYASLGSAHALSISPAGTLFGFVGLAALAVFTLGYACRLTTSRAETMARALAVIGVLVAIAGVVQKSSGTTMIYGFWTPVHNAYQIFGPFVNKNHFAGWMIMVLPLTMGSIGSALAAAARTVKPGWRDRLLWLSSPDANYILLAAVSTPIMITALLMTLSRSGIASFGLSIAVTATLLALGAGGRRRPALLGISYGVIAIAMVIGWSRPESVAARFETGSDVSLATRVHAWRDALHIARDFPLAGTGLNTFDPAMIFYQTQPGGHWDFAHNEYVQLLAEGGALLAVPALGVFLAFASLVRKRLRQDLGRGRSWWLRVGAVTGLMAIALQSTLDFSLHLPGVAILGAMLAAIAIRVPDSVR